MVRKYKGLYRIVNYSINHQQLLLGSMDMRSTCFLFKGVSEMKINDFIEDPVIELTKPHAYNAKYGYDKTKVDEKQLNCYLLKHKKSDCYVIAYSLQIYETSSLLPSSIEDISSLQPLIML